jgi:hypothetical protein
VAQSSEAITADPAFLPGSQVRKVTIRPPSLAGQDGWVRLVTQSPRGWPVRSGLVRSAILDVRTLSPEVLTSTEVVMRTMLKVQMSVEKGSQALQNGTLPKVMNGFMQEFKPEAAYFFPENGKRTCLMVFDMKDPSQIPLIVERFFMELNAEVTLTPVMNADDLKKGLEAAKVAR